MLAGFLLDDCPAHLARGEVVRETRGDESSGADTDIDVEVVEVDAFDRFVEGANRAYLVDRSLGTATGEGQADFDV